jgi:hypothetical protein
VSVIATALKHMLAAGMEHDAIISAVAEMEAEASRPNAALERRRAWDRERKRAKKSANSGGIPVESAEFRNDLVSSSPEPSSPSDPTPFTPLKGGVSPTPKRPPAQLSGFAAFWAAYPRKVGKRTAETAFAAAEKRLGGLDPDATILTGLDRCRRSKAWQTEPKFLPHPATWLNRDGWDDELDGETPKPAPGIVLLTPELQAQRLRHFQDTGEWRDAWGPRPLPEVGPAVVPFLDRRTA